MSFCERLRSQGMTRSQCGEALRQLIQRGCGCVSSSVDGNERGRPWEREVSACWPEVHLSYRRQQSVIEAVMGSSDNLKSPHNIEGTTVFRLLWSDQPQERLGFGHDNFNYAHYRPLDYHNISCTLLPGSCSCYCCSTENSYCRTRILKD